MKKHCFGAALLAAALTFSSQAMASSCSSADLKGVWVLLISEDLRCVVDIDKKAKITRGNCYPTDFSKRAGNLRGSLKVNKKCSIGGWVTISNKSGKEKSSVAGLLSGKASSFRMALRSGSSVKGVEGIRQW